MPCRPACDARSTPWRRRAAALCPAVLVVALAVAPRSAAASLADVLSPARAGNAQTAAPQQSAQATEAPRPTATPENLGPPDEFDRGTPRSSMRGYLDAARAGDDERAAEYLDLRRVRRGTEEPSGPRLARELYVVLDQTLWVNLDDLPADPTGATEDGGPPQDRVTVGSIRAERGPVDVVLDRVRREDGVRVWKISAHTVQAIPALYSQFGYGQLGEILPRPFFELRFLHIQLWQWLGLALLGCGAILVGWLATLVIVWIGSRIARRSGGALQVPLLRRLAAPLRLAAMVLLFSAAQALLGLAVPVEAGLHALETASLVVAATWGAMRFIDVAGERVVGRLTRHGQVAVTPLVVPARRAVKLLAVAIAVLVMLDNVGFNVTTLVAGLGVGGIAVALAAQKSLENLFGAITLFSDQPVRVGDFCRFGECVGTLEEIGLRSSRIRTLDRTVVAIPNAAFAAQQLENFSMRDKIWYHPTIGLRYETTPDQVRYVLVEVRRMLYAHPRVDPDPARIRFVGFGASSLDFEIFAYVKTRDFGQYLEIAEDLNLRLMDIVERAGTGFAFPSQTTYVETSPGLDPDRAQEIGKTVRAWRERGELYIPSFPDQQIQSLGGTLDYPPEGSPARGHGDGGS